MKIIILGSTGLVGSHILKLAISDNRIDSIVIPSRRPLIAANNKIKVPIVDYENLPKDALWWKADAILCALGTTMKIAGSKDRFIRVDRDYPLNAAELAFRHDTPSFVFNSAHSANSKSLIFYSRVKGQCEDALAKIGFKSLTIVRPGFIDGVRSDIRIGEKIGISLFKALAPILPKSIRVNPVQKIAQTMLEAAIASKEGKKIIESKYLI